MKQSTKKEIQTRYSFIALTVEGQELNLININPENNTVTYRDDFGKLASTALDKVTIKMIDREN